MRAIIAFKFDIHPQNRNLNAVMASGFMLQHSSLSISTPCYCTFNSSVWMILSLSPSGDSLRTIGVMYIERLGKLRDMN